jgi:hypothetical protein
MQKVIRIGMFRELGRHRANDRQVIGTAPHMGEQIAHGQAALSPVVKLPGRLQHGADIIKLGRGDLHLDRLAVLLREAGLGIECVDLRRSPIHVQEDDVLRLGFPRGLTGGQRIPRTGIPGSGQRSVGQQGRQGNRTKPIRGTLQPLTAGGTSGTKPLTMHPTLLRSTVWALGLVPSIVTSQALASTQGEARLTLGWERPSIRISHGQSASPIHRPTKTDHLYSNQSNDHHSAPANSAQSSQISTS